MRYSRPTGYLERQQSLGPAASAPRISSREAEKIAGPAYPEGANFLAGTWYHFAHEGDTVKLTGCRVNGQTGERLVRTLEEDGRLIAFGNFWGDRVVKTGQER
jgi:hypothetical protein